VSPEALARSTRSSSDRSDRLEKILQQTGLSGRVRIGLPIPPQRSPGSSQPSATPGAEEAFSPDALLRPLCPAEGTLIELVGALSSGRTALACRMTAGATRRGELAGWIDLPDALDPRSLARSGVELSCVLWVRPERLRAALRSAELLLKAGLALVVLDLEGAPLHELERLGAAVWTRLARAARAARSCLVLLAPRPLAGTSATLALELERRRARFESGLLEGLDSRLHVTRGRSAADRTTLDFRLHHRLA
jgi:RecA DNA recombination protein